MPSSVASSSLWSSQPPVQHPASVRDGDLSSLAVEYDAPLDPRSELKRGLYFDSSEVQGKPCRLLAWLPIKPGKNGGKKALISAVDVSTGKRIDTWLKGSVQPALLARSVCTCVAVDDDDFLTLLSPAGECCQDVQLPRWDAQCPGGVQLHYRPLAKVEDDSTNYSTCLADQIRHGLAKDMVVTVTVASWARHSLEFVESVSCEPEDGALPVAHRMPS